MGKLVRKLKIGQNGKEHKVANKLQTTIRGYLTDTNITKRYIRPTEAAELLDVTEQTVMELALAAGAIYKVGNSALVNTELFEKFLEQYREPSRPLPKHTWGNLPPKENTPKSGANT